MEWYTSDTAQEAVSTVLAPLSDLGGARSERLIQTLHVYLDKHCSLARTAKLLDVDPDNPDDMLLLALACRARELAKIRVVGGSGRRERFAWRSGQRRERAS